MRLLVASLIAACSASPTTTRSPEARDAAVDADPEARKACEARCERVVMGRHDACGHRAGPPWPEWCGRDNERMRENCEASCR